MVRKTTKKTAAAKPAKKAKPANQKVAAKTSTKVAAKTTEKPVAPYAMVAEKAGGPSVFKKVPLELPKPKKGEVLIRHTAIGINFLDVYQRTGLYPLEFPTTLGNEGAGVVEALGAGVKGLKVGDRVAYVVNGGAYASHRIIAADRLVKIPPKVSDAEAAAAMLKGLTVQYLVNDCYKPKKGETVLFQAAAGGVGLIAGQWLKAIGVNAIGTAGGAAKCKLAKASGYTQVIDYRAKDFVAEVKRLTKGKGVPAVYDSVGKDTFPGSLQVLRKFGIYVLFGQSSGVVTDFKLSDLAAGGSLFVTRPTLFHFIAERTDLERRARQLFSMMSSGKVKIKVNQTFALSDVAKAHKALEARQTTGQTVLIP